MWECFHYIFKLAPEQQVLWKVWLEFQDFVPRIVYTKKEKKTELSTWKASTLPSLYWIWLSTTSLVYTHTQRLSCLPGRRPHCPACTEHDCPLPAWSDAGSHDTDERHCQNGTSYAPDGIKEIKDFVLKLCICGTNSKHVWGVYLFFLF